MNPNHPDLVIPPINGQIPEISSSSTSSRSVLSSRVRIQNPESEGSYLQTHRESTESDPRSSSALPNGKIPKTSGSSTSSRSVSSGIPRIQNPESEGSTLQTHRGYAESDPRSSLRSRLCDNSSGCTYVFDRSVTQRSHKVPQASQDNQSSSIENGLINGIIVESAQVQIPNIGNNPEILGNSKDIMSTPSHSTAENGQINGIIVESSQVQLENVNE
eukprot:576318_1